MTRVPFEEGDEVVVEGIDGKRERARVVEHVDAVAGEHVLFEDKSVGETTVAQYWGQLVDEDDPVVRVRYIYENEDGDRVEGEREYDFPASKVDDVDEDDPEVRTDGGRDLEDDEEEEAVDVDRELFEDAVDALGRIETTIDTLSEEIADLETGLSHSDTVALLYGRRNDLTKTEIKTAFETLDQISSASTRTLTKRLLADMGSMTQAEADAFLDEVERLRSKYGDSGRGSA